MKNKVIVGDQVITGSLYVGERMKGQLSPNTKIVQEDQTIQSVIDSCDSPAVDNPYEIQVPPSHEDESFTEASYIHVHFTSDGLGKTLDLSSNTTFKRSDGSNFIINCTAASEFNSSGGAFSTGFQISVLNIGTHIITIDSMHDINPSQRGTYTFDGTEFQGGV